MTTAWADPTYITWILGGISTVIIYFIYLWILIRPAAMWFYDKQIPISAGYHKRDWITLKAAPNKPTTVFIGLRLRWPRTFKEIDVRFVSKDPLWPWLLFASDDTENSMEVLSLEDQNFSILNDQDYFLIKNVDNKAGGRAASYKDQVDCPYYGWMWYALTISATKTCDGFLSFQIRRGNKLQGVVRRKVHFIIEK